MANTKTALNFKWGTGLEQNSPVYSAGTVYVAYDEKAMYVDAPNGRIRLGDFITCTYEELIAKPADWTETALYYISDKNALAKWNPKGGENEAGAWTIINDTSSLEDLIAANALAISNNADAISDNADAIDALEKAVGTDYVSDKESNEYKGSILGRLDNVEMSIGSGGSVEDRFEAVEDKVTVLEDLLNGTEEDDGLIKKVNDQADSITGLQSSKADASVVETLSETVDTLTQTVADNKAAAEEAIGEVAKDLAAYVKSNNTALGLVSDKADENADAIALLQAADETLQNNINTVDGKLNNYVLKTVYNARVEAVDGLIDAAQKQADKGVADAKAADDKAVAAGNAAAAAQTTADQGKALAGTASAAATKAQEEIDALELIVYGAEANKPTDKTILQLIAEAKADATYDDTAVRGLIKDNADGIAALETAMTTKVESSVVEALDKRVGANETTIAGINTKIGTVADGENLADLVKDAKKAGTDAAAALETYKGTNDAKITALEAKDEAQDAVINSKAAQADLNALEQAVNEKDAAQDLLIKANQDAITNLTKANGTIATIESAVNKNKEDITKLDTRLSTAEGTLKTTVEETIPAIANRVKTLEDNMDSYATDDELAGVKSALEAKINTAQQQADKGVEEAGKAQTAAENAQKDATDALEQLEAIKDSENLDSFADVEAAIAASFAANDAMVFKGVLGTKEGQVAALPENALSGHTYKVAEAGTYNDQKAQVGDLFINVDGEWKYVPSGNEDQDTITISGSDEAVISLSSVTELARGSVAFVGGESVEVTGTAPDADGQSTIAISMVWGTW